MAYAVQYTKSLAFVIQMYLMMAIMAIACFPICALSREMSFPCVRLYCAWIRWTARWMVGIETEIRGKVPEGETLIAGKHQSFLDVILIVSVAPRPKFIMKKSIKWLPFVGYYAMRIGCVPIEREKRGKIIGQMVRDVEEGRAKPGQLIIFPQGTRVAPGETKPYKIGAAVLYQEMGQPCVPVATNVGVLWPKRSFYRKPGKAVVEFLEPLAPGLERGRFMKEIEARIEGESNRLMREAGFGREPAGS